MMDEDAAIIESILREEAKLNGEHLEDHDSGWKTVSYPRRQRKQHHQPPPSLRPENGFSDDVFRPIDQHAEERRRRVVEAQRAALAAASGGSKEVSGEDSGDDDSDAGGFAGAGVNGNVEAPVKKPKVKKPKKPKVSVAEAAAKIDADDLAAFLVDISGSYESQEDIQLMRFADYYGRAFSSVGSAQFPWMKMLKESSIQKMVDIPLSNIPEAVYKTSMDWLNRRSLDALGSLVLSLWDGILADLATHQGPVKGSKKVAPQQPSSKSQVAFFVVLGMILRRKPDVLICLLPILKESQKYVGQDKLPVAVWVIAQTCQGDLGVGLYMWVHVLLPMLNGKSVNPQSRDLILQLVERILAMPKARQILLNGAVRKGERLVPPAAFDNLMRLTFPSSSSRIKATERFEAVYPTLKEVALAGASGSKAMKQVAQHIMGLAIKAAGEGVPELAKEASGVFIWCLTENPECYKQWDNLYLNHIEASAVILRKLSEERKLQSATPSTLGTVKTTLKSFREKNEKALASKEYSDRQTYLKEADKYSKSLISQVSRGHGCLKGFVAVSVVLTLGFAVLSANMSPEDLKQLVPEDLKQLVPEDLKQLLAKFDLEHLKAFIPK